MSRLYLPNVTLIAATSINIDATIRAMKYCQANIRFGASKLLTDKLPGQSLQELEIVVIPELQTSREYSHFVLQKLADHVETSHCLLVQWDGFVIKPDHWSFEFLDYDYVGASWPQFDDGHDVGNGGFSLRSSRLLEACRSEHFIVSHPEDVAIGRHNRVILERNGLRFASLDIANRFSSERASTPDYAFGFHGVWHMPGILGYNEFWEIYRRLDDRSSVYQNKAAIMRGLAQHPHGLWRCAQLVWDNVCANSTKRKGANEESHDWLTTDRITPFPSDC